MTAADFEKRYHRLAILGETKMVKGKTAIKAKCDCGTVGFFILSSIKAGRIKSCGCLKREIVTAFKYKDGRKKFPEFHIWSGMMQRCYRPKTAYFKSYGGRGIKVCDRWHDCMTFIRDMGPRPSLEHSIDRINNDGNYEPSNCRWATRIEQASNTSRTIKITLNGVTYTQTAFARLCGVTATHIRHLRKQGLSAQEMYERFV